MKFFLKSSVFLLSVWLFSCVQNESTVAQKQFHHLQGKCMGTTYNVKFETDKNIDFKKEIDDLLWEIETEVSTYIDTSVISKINYSDKDFELDGDVYSTSLKGSNDQHFRYNYGIAKLIYNRTEGAFDPTVMPLVNYWGFGPIGNKKRTSVDSAKVAGLLPLVGFEDFEIRNSGGKYFLKKKNGKSSLDFSALAKGYGVDQVGKLLSKKGVENYFVEIGGEIKVQGNNPEGNAWRVGVNTPKENAPVSDYQEILHLKNKALATSGNYRNFYEIDGVKYAHTINPQTGFPELNRLLSASVVADNCITADAYATAFMVLGLEKAFTLAESIDRVEAYLIFSDEKGEMKSKYTKGFSEFLSPPQ